MKNAWRQYRLATVCYGLLFCFFYPVSLACWNPAVVHSLPGAVHFLAQASSRRFSLAQPHFCLKPAGGGDVPAQPHAALPRRTLRHWQRNVVSHSLHSTFWNKQQRLHLEKKNSSFLICSHRTQAQLLFFFFTFLVFERAELISDRLPLPPNLHDEFLHFTKKSK